MVQPEVKYTKVAGADVAYQVVGNGPIDLVLARSMASNLDVQWQGPAMANALQRLASFSRLILFDRRGAGLSDPVVLETLPSWEHWADDLEAVLDAAGSERAAIMTEIDSGPWGILFAAAHPERVHGLILWNAYARGGVGMPPEQSDTIQRFVAQLWGTEALARIIVPSLAEDEVAMRWMVRLMRGGVTPSSMASYMQYENRIDVSGLLSSIQVPTLVLHRTQNFSIPRAEAHLIAEGIPGARLVEVPGQDLVWWGEGVDDTLAMIQEFLTGTAGAVPTDRVLATVLFTDIVGSTERAAQIGDTRWKKLLDEHDRETRRTIERHGGSFVKGTGDGSLATFDGPTRAIRCAFDLADNLRDDGIEIRAGLHTGEIEKRHDDVGGIGVHIAARVVREAGPGEVVCSRTVKDLVAGSEFTFEDRGVRALKGVPDEWQLYVVRSGQA